MMALRSTALGNGGPRDAGGNLWLSPEGALPVPATGADQSRPDAGLAAAIAAFCRAEGWGIQAGAPNRGAEAVGSGDALPRPAPVPWAPAGLDAGWSLKARSRSSPPIISLEQPMAGRHAGTARSRHARLSPLRCRFGASGRWLTGPRGRLSGCRSRVTTAVVATRPGVRESLKRSAFVCDPLDSSLLVPTPLENAVAASRGRPAASGIARRNARA